jgi:hypothetical protein
MTTILHLSDTHFGPSHAYPDYTKNTYKLAEFIANDVKQLGAKPDCIVLSGDITDGAATLDFRHASAFLNALKERLGSPEIGLVVVPGNHDVNWTSYKSDGRDQAFLAYHRFVRSGLSKPCLDANDDSCWFTDQWSNGSVFVLGLNTCIVDSPTRPGVGYVDQAQMEAAKARFEGTWHSHPVRVAVVHHHLLPVAYTYHDPTEVRTDSLTLNAEEVMRWLANNDFHVLLHGHQHQPFFGAGTRYAYDDVEGSTNAISRQQHLVVIGAGSVGAKREDLGTSGRREYNILRFEGGRLNVTAREMHGVSSDRFQAYRQPFSIPLRSTPSAKMREVLDGVALHSSGFADKARRLDAGVVIEVDLPTLITLFPSVLAAADDEVISTSTLPASAAFWGASLGAMVLKLSKQRQGGNLRRIFIAPSDEPNLLSLMEQQEQAGVKASVVGLWQHRDIARQHLTPILEGLAPLGLNEADASRIFDAPELLALAVYGSGADRFLGFDFKSTMGFIFDPKKELVDSASKLLEALCAESQKLEDLKHSSTQRTKRTIALFGAHKWRRGRVVREALAAGLRVLLFKAETDTDVVHPFVESMVYGVFNVSDTVPPPAELRQLADKLTSVHGKEWCVLALDDYAAQTASLLAEVGGRDYFPVRAEAMTRRKHEMRERWNRLCADHEGLLVHPVAYEYRDYEGAPGSPRRQSGAGFESHDGSFIIKPDELSASIEIHSANDRDQIEPTVQAMLERLADYWAPLGAKHGIAVRQRVQIEAQIPRAALQDCSSAEFSVEVITTGGQHRVVGVTQKWITGDFVEVGHVFPAAAFPSQLKQTLEQCIRILLDDMKVAYAISHWEFIVTPDYRLALVEAQLRPGGDRIMELVERATGQSIEGALLRWLAGRSPPTEDSFPHKCFAAVCFLAPETCVDRFTGHRVVSGAEELCKELQVDADALRSGPWEGPSDWTNRHVSVICVGRTLEEARGHCAEAASSVRLSTSSGEVRLRIP